MRIKKLSEAIMYYLLNLPQLVLMIYVWRACKNKFSRAVQTGQLVRSNSFALLTSHLWLQTAEIPRLRVQSHESQRCQCSCLTKPWPGFSIYKYILSQEKLNQILGSPHAALRTQLELKMVLVRTKHVFVRFLIHSTLLFILVQQRSFLNKDRLLEP